MEEALAESRQSIIDANRQSSEAATLANERERKLQARVNDYETRQTRDNDTIRTLQADNTRLNDQLAAEQTATRDALQWRTLEHDRSNEVKEWCEKERQARDMVIDLEGKLSRLQATDDARIRSLTHDIERDNKRLIALQRDCNEYKSQVITLPLYIPLCCSM
jgi:chromosome segregation ATPase